MNVRRALAIIGCVLLVGLVALVVTAILAHKKMEVERNAKMTEPARKAEMERRAKLAADKTNTPVSPVTSLDVAGVQEIDTTLSDEK